MIATNRIDGMNASGTFLSGKIKEDREIDSFLQFSCKIVDE